MNSRNSSLLCLTLALLAMSSAIEAFDITKMLGQYPELGLFNQYLTETKLAEQINGRQTITVLALDNSSVTAISGKTMDTIKAILSTHVILDYFDEMKLMSTVETQNTQLTTLYQTTGPTNNLLGFIKVGLVGEGEIAFGSAVNGAPLNVDLVKTVTTQPYNISIIQVSQPIIAPGIDAQSPPSTSSASSPPPPPTPKAIAPSSPSTSTSSPTSSPTPKAKAPSSPPTSSASSPTPSPTPKAKAPVASRKQISPAPEISPASETSPAPEISPSPEEAGTPLSAPDEAPAPASSSSSPRLLMGLDWAIVMGLGALLVVM